MTTQSESTSTHATTTPLIDTIAETLKCILGGVGAAMIAAVIVAWLVSSWWIVVAVWAIVTGLGLVWMVVESPLEREMLRLEVDSLDDKLEEAETRLAAMTAERDRYKRENETYAMLRNASNNYVTPEAETDTVRQDAWTLVEAWLTTGAHPSRKKMEGAMSQQRHAAAMEYLTNKGGVSINGPVVTWKINTREQAETVLG